MISKRDSMMLWTVGTLACAAVALAVYPSSTLSPSSKVSAAWVEATGTDIWEDLNFPATAFNPPGLVDDPDLMATWGPSGNLMSLAFDKDTDETMFVNVQMPHGWQLGTDVHPHLHISPNTATTGNVVWAFTYTWANVIGTSVTYGASTTVTTTQTFTTAKQYQHLLHNLATVSGVGKTESSVLVCSVMRDANASADNYDQDIHMLSFDVHYRPGGLGRVFTP